MAEKTNIEWTRTLNADGSVTQGATWNFVTGCSIESPGCTNCYAMRLAGGRLRHHPTRAGLTKQSPAGPVWTGEVRFNEGMLKQPLSWQRPRKIFVVAHGDLFHPNVSFDWIDRGVVVMLLARQHTYQVLTKRVQRMLSYFRSRSTLAGLERLRAVARSMGLTLDVGNADLAQALAHAWLGVSVENQRYANLRRESLAQLAAAGWITWVSYEPALGPVNWRGWEFVRWAVSGGESGAGARPSHPAWHRQTRDFFGDRYLFKQWGSWVPRSPCYHTFADGSSCADMDPSCKRWPFVTKLTYSGGDGHRLEDVDDGDDCYMQLVGKTFAGRLLDGLEHNGFPEVAR